jgi:hypothetical protein
VSSTYGLQVVENEKKILYPSHEINFIAQTVPDHFTSSTITPYE